MPDKHEQKEQDSNFSPGKNKSKYGTIYIHNIYVKL